ncbi:biopolymer transporter ExbB [Mesobaculum littorinae]|uniref:Biopolymer transporter ExbB n=1 Tax=Mesobaculum littorinae TaxID=2486419 RepID=A0A438AE47_9RHOB|nr:biopolymer transporter ExbB [Mesobaculum littorinae]RVV96976.1 biopolymer transporter ExbB [Mesobaculum littorinae]
MSEPDREAAAQFSQPVRQIVMMLIVLVLVALGAYVAFPRVAPVFLANPWLNGFIGLVFVLGVMACFWQVMQLVGSVNWIEGHAAGNPGHENVAAPRLLAPLAALMRSRGRAMQISPTSSRSILDSVATRIDEERDITRYIANFLIFLGLLGTFYGLATTVPAIVDTIRNLAPQEGEDGMEVFSRLMSGLEAQLGGMGVAFASSLLGLAGSLVVGLLELFAGHGQNRFYRELEEWLSSITRLGFSTGEGEMSSDQAMIASMMEHVAQQMDRLQALYVASDESRAQVDARLADLAGSVERLTARMEAEGSVTASLDRVAEGQGRLAEVLEAQIEQASGGIDAESRMRLRSIDVQLLRLLEEISAGRQEATSELRQDLRQLLRAVRNQAPAGRPGGDLGRVGGSRG